MGLKMADRNVHVEAKDVQFQATGPLHSDRSCQLTSDDYQRRLTRHRPVSSMSAAAETTPPARVASGCSSGNESITPVQHAGQR